MSISRNLFMGEQLQLDDADICIVARQEHAEQLPVKPHLLMFEVRLARCGIRPNTLRTRTRHLYAATLPPDRSRLRGGFGFGRNTGSGHRRARIFDHRPQGETA
ncbi:hypothetical protein P3W85_32460 [Cupriavidus basilensis]|uniref:Uncharacterized protein n=1 Tax=Cupriavidus basilensis TaxID=68895 RepID=A0ABT6AYC3_9BURK|nr:hypothetical protein [Cupriavidus basilensis]MDF3837620.1 hypothetical protein [Cupriavidus basilensis]